MPAVPWYNPAALFRLDRAGADTMSFLQRAPSTVWEAVPLPTQPPVVVWGWFKPVAAPNSVVLQLPPALWQSGVSSDQLTLRTMIQATGVEVLIGWTLYGQHLLLTEQTLAWLTARLPPSEAFGDQQLILWSQTAVPMMAPSLPLATDAAAAPAALDAVSVSEMAIPSAGTGDLLPGENPAPYLDLIDFYWTNIQYIESDIRRVRVQLDQSLSKLGALNRDLNFEELYAADSADKQQWQDARRWLRDAAASLSRSMKEIDVGLMSSAGQRNRFLDIHEQYVKPRIPFPGIKQAAAEFEMHHKSVKNVLTAATTALHKGSSDGERRANAVLARIHQKARQKSNQARGKNA